jgi:hypothetical protein
MNIIDKIVQDIDSRNLALALLFAAAEII